MPRTRVIMLVACCLLFSILPLRATAVGVFGDGSDGALTVSGTEILTADKNYTDLTITASGTLDTRGYVVRVSETLRNDGVIADLGSGGNGGSAGSP
jgi:hypothetical protein